MPTLAAPGVELARLLEENDLEVVPAQAETALAVPTSADDLGDLGMFEE
jgi:hypothetical protein